MRSIAPLLHRCSYDSRFLLPDVYIRSIGRFLIPASTLSHNTIQALLDNPPKALPSTETEPKTSAPTPAPTPTVEVVAVAEAPVEAEAETEGPKNEVPAVVVAAPVVEAEAEVAEGPKHTEYLFVAPDAAGACVEECKEGEDDDEEPMWLHDIDLFLDAPTPKPITPAPTTSGLATIRAAVAKATASVDAFFRAAGRMVVTATCRVAKAGRAAGAGVVTVVHGLAGRVAALMA